MIWKTSTTIFILLASVGAIGFFYFDKESKIKLVHETIDNKIAEGVNKKSIEIENQFRATITDLEKENKNLQVEIEKLKERINIVRYGGEMEKYRNQIKANSIKSEEKLKIRKGEVYKDKRSGFVVYIRKDFYEAQLLVNLTLPDRVSEELYWDIGKYYYYWNSQRNELSQIMVTFIGDDIVELEWLFYKEKPKNATQ